MSESSTCPYCGDTMSHPRRKQCGKPECKRAYQAERCRVWQQEYRRKHGIGYGSHRYPAQRLQQVREWRAANPESVKASWAIDRVHRQTGMHINAEKFLYEDIFDRDAWHCGICGKKVSRIKKHPHPASASLDHIVPLSQGGQHVRANVRCAHLVCNTTRNNRGGDEQLLLVG